LALLAVAVQSVGVLDSMKRYRQLEGLLRATRVCHEGRESPEEDRILDEMDAVWWKLGESDRQLVNDEGPRCWPVDDGS
jgi:hypothetical protein